MGIKITVLRQYDTPIAFDSHETLLDFILELDRKMHGEDGKKEFNTVLMYPQAHFRDVKEGDIEYYSEEAIVDDIPVYSTIGYKMDKKIYIFSIAYIENCEDKIYRISRN